MTGIVRDQAGWEITTATVTVRKPGEKKSLALKHTNIKGRYRFKALEPGTYNVCAQAAGFKSTCREAVVVKAGENTIDPIPMALESSTSGGIVIQAVKP